MNREEKSFVKSVALFMSFILVVAIIGWVTPIVEAGEPEALKKLLEEIKGMDKAQSKYQYEFKIADDGTVEVLKKLREDRSKTMTSVGTVSDLSTLKEGLGVGDSNLLTVDYGDDKKQVVSLDKDSLKGVESIFVSSGRVTYGLKEGGEVAIESSGTYLVNKVVKVDGKDVDKKFLKGYKIGGKDVTVELKVGEKSIVKVEKNGFSYAGKGAQISVGETKFENIGLSGSLEFVNDKVDSFVVKNTKVESKEYTLVASEKKEADGSTLGVYIGSEDPPLELKGRSLKLEDNKLSGDLNGLGDKEEVVFRKNVKEDVTVDESILGDQEIKVLNSEKPEVTFKKDEKGNVQGYIKPGSSSTSTIVDSDGNDGPDIPATPVQPPGAGTPTTPKTPTDPLPPVGPPGPVGPGSSMLKWLLIGGAVLVGALLLMGLMKKDKGSAKATDGVDDGGKPYMGQDNESVPKEITAPDDDNKGFLYNPSERPGGSCDLNSSGYFNCPDDDCTRCVSVNINKPMIQGDDGAVNEEGGTAVGNGSNSS